MNLKALKSAIDRAETPCIELHATEQILYIPFLREGDSLQPLTENNKSLTFPSRSRALATLAGTGLQSVEFVHRSSYGEMIGSEGSMKDTEFRQTIDLSRYLTT